MKLRSARVHITMLMIGVCQVLPAQTNAGVGAFSGRVVDADGKALAGAVVHYRKLDNLVRDRDKSLRAVPPFVNDTVSTGPDGTFSVSRLPAGTYFVCALATQLGQLGSCEWNQSNGRQEVAAERTTTVPTLVIRNGRKIIFRILDSSGRFSQSRKLLIGVMSEAGYYRRAQVQPSVAGVALTLAATVPLGINAGAFIDTDLILVDKDTKPVPLRKRGPPIEAGAAGAETIIELRTN